MKNIFKISLLFIFIGFITLQSQTRYAVLPFQNGEGIIDLNIWSYELQDSCQKAFAALAEENDNFVIVPADSVEELLAEMNLDPTNPQYQSDMWKAVQMLNVDKVITGVFYSRANKILINAYVYDVKTKLADPDYKAENIFKDPDKALSAVNIILKRLKPLLLKN